MNPALIGIPTIAALGAAATSYAAYHPSSQLLGPAIYQTASAKQLALTFDDGPNPPITPRLLNLLEQHNAKATFFLIGRFAQECPALVKEIAARGHLIANHTQTHPNLFWLGSQGIREELQRCQGVLQEVSGSAAKYFRPPFGIRNPWVIGTAKRLGMQTVLWTQLPGDWRGKPAEWLRARMQVITENLEKSAERSAGDVLCLHDGAHRHLGGDRAGTLGALEYWLPRWRDMGAKFVTIAEAVGNPAT